MEKLTDYTNLCYASYNGQIKQLRQLAINKLGCEKVAMMSNCDVEDYFRKSGYIPMVACVDDGICNTETIYLIKEDTLNNNDVLKLYR